MPSFAKWFPSLQPMDQNWLWSTCYTTSTCVCVCVFPRIISINGRGNAVRAVAIKKHFILQPASQRWNDGDLEHENRVNNEQQRQHIIYAL